MLLTHLTGIDLYIKTSLEFYILHYAQTITIGKCIGIIMVYSSDVSCDFFLSLKCCWIWLLIVWLTLTLLILSFDFRTQRFKSGQRRHSIYPQLNVSSRWPLIFKMVLSWKLLVLQLFMGCLSGRHPNNLLYRLSCLFQWHTFVLVIYYYGQTSHSWMSLIFWNQLKVSLCLWTLKPSNSLRWALSRWAKTQCVR